MYISTVTRQGQISIPAKLRRKMDIDRKRVMISEANGKITIEPVIDFLAMRGSLKTNKKPLSHKQLHDFVEASIAEEYAAKLKKTR